MLAYEPGKTLAHHLDPRTKLLLQIGFALAAFSYTSPEGLFTLTLLVLVSLRLSDIRLYSALWSYRFVFPFLIAGPAVGSFSLGPPWLSLSDALQPAFASYRVVLILLISGIYVRTTSIRESQAAIQKLVPGRTGRILSLGVGFVFRFVPLLREDLRTIRDATAARLGDERSVSDRIQLVATSGLSRAFKRSSHLTLALQTRCLSWNPTMPTLCFSRIDVIPLVVGFFLLAVSLLSLIPGL